MTCENGVHCEVKVFVAFSIQPDNVQIDVKNNVDVDVNVDVKFLQAQLSFGKRVRKTNISQLAISLSKQGVHTIFKENYWYKNFF